MKTPTTIPTENRSETAPTAPPNLNDLLDRMEYDRLMPTAAVLCVLYLVYTVGHPATMAPGIAGRMAALSLTSAAIYAIFLVTFHRFEYPRNWSHRIAAFLSGLTLLNSIVHLYLTGDPWQTTNLALVILASGVLFLSYLWLAVIVVSAFASLAAIAWTQPHALWMHFGFMLITASAIAAMAQAGSIRMVARLASVQGRVHEMALRLDAEEALRKSRIRNQELVAAIPDLIFRIDRNGRFLDYHARAEYELFAPPSEFMGQTIAAVMPEEQAAILMSGLKRTIETHETQVFEHEWTNESGPRYGECRMVYCEGDEALAFSRDIGEKKQQARELREAERRYRALVERVPGIIYTRRIQAEGECTYISPQISSFGFTPREWLANPDLWRDRLHPDDRERVLTATRQARESRRPLLLEYRIFDSEQRLRWLHDEAAPVRGDDGTPLYWQGILIDITQRKNEEAEARELQHKMQHAEKLKSLGLLAGGIAHDFNNLLVGVLGNTELALERLEYDHQSRPYINEANLAGQRAAELTHQMLAYAGMGRMAEETVSLCDVITGMKPLIDSAVSKKAEIRYSLPEKPAPIDADVTQIRQVILNLLINASEALQGGAGEIAVKVAFWDERRKPAGENGNSPELAPGEYILLEVSDSGCGMNEETLARLFEPFYTTKFTGRGLGLAAVRGIVAGHGGAITVKSALDQGATFRVWLPSSSQPLMSLGSPPEKDDVPAPERVSGTVLVVDDEAVVRSVARAALEGAGFDVITAGRGEEGLALFRQHGERLSAVVLDLDMPGMDGNETYHLIRQISGRVPIILMSGYGQTGAAKMFAAPGAAPFLPKPFAPRGLLDQIYRAIGATSALE